MSVLSPAVLETCTVRVRAERRTWRGSLGVHRASQSSHACLSGLARGLLLRPYLSLVHVLHSLLRSLGAAPVHEEGCAQQLCRHGVRCRRGTKGVVSSPSEDIPSDLKETEAHLRTAGEVREQVVGLQSRAAFQVPV